VKTTRVVMGMPITIEVVSGKDLQVRKAIDGAFGHLHWVDKTFSAYKPDSEISRINQGELKLADAHSLVQQVISACDEMRDRTEGYFDMRRSDGTIDPSGYVKGWAIWGTGGLLEESGMPNFCIEAGGDILVRGHNSEGEPWRVGIRNPVKGDEIVKVLRVNNGAVATSGTYERGEHIYNPHTGVPAAELASVTVMGPDIIWADVAATAAFAMGGQGAEWLAREPGLECYVIGHDGKAMFTPGLKRYFL
jgi:thiamine biosynthesis lipoprotein